MKGQKIHRSLAGTLVLTSVLVLQPAVTHATIGYYNQVFLPGANWFGNQLLNTNSSISFLIPTPPEGTTVSLWSPAGGYGLSARYHLGIWCGDFVLPMGEGAVLTTSALFTNTFSGTVLNPDGTVYTGSPSFPLPPPFAKPNGVYLLACKTPLILPYAGTNVFYFILGRDALLGESFTRLNPATQVSTKTTVISTVPTNTWDNGEPALNVGDAAFFNVGPAPTPVYRVTAIAREGNDIRITWTSYGAHTNVVQTALGSPATDSCGDGFNDLSPMIVVPGPGQFTTNYLHVGGATNTPAIYYRIRLVP